MNASLSASPSPATSSAPRAKPRNGPWIWSLTGVCFLFGGLVAAQLRAVKQMNENRATAAKTQLEASRQAVLAKKQFDAEKKRSDKLQAQLVSLQNDLKSRSTLTQQEMTALNARLTELQGVAGLTPIAGAGITITLADSPIADQVGNDGIVHDFDILQVVNELRNVRAEAIAINGTRISGYTPIRCVGAPILVNWEPVTAPFRIEAVGDPRKLEASMNLPGGIVDALRKRTLVARVQRSSRLSLPATESLPRLRSARSETRSENTRASDSRISDARLDGLGRQTP